MITGIANSYPLAEHLKCICNDLTSLEFPDHHSYILKNIKLIKEEFDKIFPKGKIIVTTERDAMRMQRDMN